MDFLSYFALALIILVVLILAYGLIAIHDIPYHIAQKRNHPHQDAIHSGGWVSLFTLHAIWPFLWIWATSYHPEHGYSGRPKETKPQGEPKISAANPPDVSPSRLAALEERIARLESELHQKNSL